MSSTAKLTAEQIENLAKEIREFLLEHGLWQDVDIYFNGKRFTQHDPVTGKYYYNDREHLIEEENQDPRTYFEYVNPDHILSMSFEGPVCEMLYYGILPSVRREFDKIFERYGFCTMSSGITGISVAITFEKGADTMNIGVEVLKESVIRVQSQLNDWMDCVFVVSKDDEEKAREVLEKAWDSFWEDGDGWCYGNYLEDKLVNAGIAFDAYYADAEE